MHGWTSVVPSKDSDKESRRGSGRGRGSTATPETVTHALPPTAGPTQPPSAGAVLFSRGPSGAAAAAAQQQQQGRGRAYTVGTAAQRSPWQQAHELIDYPPHGGYPSSLPRDSALPYGGGPMHAHRPPPAPVSTRAPSVVARAPSGLTTIPLAAAHAPTVLSPTIPLSRLHVADDAPTGEWTSQHPSAKMSTVALPSTGSGSGQGKSGGMSPHSVDGGLRLVRDMSSRGSGPSDSSMMTEPRHHGQALGLFTGSPASELPPYGSGAMTPSSSSSRRRRRPPFSYSNLITQAIASAPEGKMTLREIYTWISNSYPDLYQVDGRDSQGWQNTVRHNLSLNKMFVKVPRSASDPAESASNSRGKGGYWMLDPAAAANSNIAQQAAVASSQARGPHMFSRGDESGLVADAATDDSGEGTNGSRSSTSSASSFAPSLPQFDAPPAEATVFGRPRNATVSYGTGSGGSSASSLGLRLFHNDPLGRPPSDLQLPPIGGAAWSAVRGTGGRSRGYTMSAADASRAVAARHIAPAGADPERRLSVTNSPYMRPTLSSGRSSEMLRLKHAERGPGGRSPEPMSPRQRTAHITLPSIAVTDKSDRPMELSSRPVTAAGSESSMAMDLDERSSASRPSTSHTDISGDSAQQKSRMSISGLLNG